MIKRGINERKVKGFKELESESDYNPRFTEAMKNAMVVGRQKYGPWKNNRLEIDCIKNILDRLEKYKQTGNTEWLVDLGNFAMMEFTLPMHPNAHFRGTDSSEAPKLKRFGD